MGFDSIIGYEDIKQNLYRTLDQLKNPDKYKAMNARMIHGILLDGIAGVGKTSLCKALIEEADVKSFVVRKDCSEADLIEKIKKTFDEAMTFDPSIILLDDVDKFADVSERDRHRASEVFVAIQAAIDKVKDKNVLVLATSNRSDCLPESLTRAGRLTKIKVPNPKQEDVRSILEYYLQDKTVADDINVDDIARMLGNSAVSELEDILREAAVEACYQGESAIRMKDIVGIIVKRELKYVDSDECEVKESVMRQTAYHEAGHLLASIAFGGIECVGYAALMPRESDVCDGIVSRCKWMRRRPHRVITSLAGKIACEMHDPKVASGCANDIEKAVTSIREGISTNATLGFDFIDTSVNEPTSEALLAKQEIATLEELNRYTYLCKKFLMSNKDLLEALATALFEKHLLLNSDVKKIVDGHVIQTLDIWSLWIDLGQWFVTVVKHLWGNYNAEDRKTLKS